MKLDQTQNRLTSTIRRCIIRVTMKNCIRLTPFSWHSFRQSSAPEQQLGHQLPLANAFIDVGFDRAGHQDETTPTFSHCMHILPRELPRTPFPAMLRGRGIHRHMVPEGNFRSRFYARARASFTGRKTVPDKHVDVVKKHSLSITRLKRRNSAGKSNFANFSWISLSSLLNSTFTPLILAPRPFSLANVRPGY